MKKISLLSLFILLILGACREGIDDVNVDITTPHPTLDDYTAPVENVSADVVGYVIDENNTAVSQATVMLNDQITTTDEFGHFFFNNQTMNSLGTLVQVQKDGYFKGSRRFFPIANEGNRIKIQLMEKSFNSSFSASTGGTVSVGDVTVRFSAASIQATDGSPYNGMVHVATKWLDPTSQASLDQMPGNLQGVNSSIEQVSLGSYGIQAVELEGDSGESLNIVNGQTARIEMPVPSELLQNAPRDIQLWSYNEEHGLWVEESTATLENGMYVGDVTHFSFWMYCAPYDLVQFSLNLEDLTGQALDNHRVNVIYSVGNQSIVGSGYTDRHGGVCGFIPANEVLTLEILDICGDEIYTSSIGPFASDTDLGVLTLTNVNNNTVITGALRTCSGDPVDNGLVIVSIDGRDIIHHYTTDPQFSIAFVACQLTAGDIEVVAVDLDNLERSDPYTVEPYTTVDLGLLNACDNEIDSYVIITVDGADTKTFIDPTAIYLSDHDHTWIQDINSPDGTLGIGFFGGTIGDYSTENTSEVIKSGAYSWDLTAISYPVFENFDVSEYGSRLVGTFSGEMYNNTNGMRVIVQVTGEFNIKL